ncbi:hypothetical protein CP533_2075 [Ophiocordyceps camponoti-saundersi (nom. inval.)]|nr:hypothetical protein CP533_2075 [Ophiocordyceps camponoti-saundersi (nom. inval.)]
MATTSSAIRFIGPLNHKPPLMGVIQIHLHVNPGSSNIKLGVVKLLTADRIHINIGAQARDGAANLATIAFLAQITQLPPSRFSLRFGHRGREKTFEIQGVEAKTGPLLVKKFLNKFLATLKNDNSKKDKKKGDEKKS